MPWQQELGIAFISNFYKLLGENLSEALEVEPGEQMNSLPPHILYHHSPVHWKQLWWCCARDQSVQCIMDWGCTNVGLHRCGSKQKLFMHFYAVNNRLKKGCVKWFSTCIKTLRSSFQKKNDEGKTFQKNQLYFFHYPVIQPIMKIFS